MDNDWIRIDSAQKLKKARAHLAAAKLIGIDTEYDSFHYFREKLCLLQIITEKKIYLFDPLLDLDLSVLGEPFASASSVKILHAGDNDLRILKRDYSFKFQNIFDTQRAAGLLGSRFLSLSSVVSEYLGIELSKPKRVQRSRWEERPLSQEQINYAVEDIKYLIPLYQRLRDELAKKGLDKQAARTFDEEITSAQWTEKTLDHSAYKRIAGFDSLQHNQRRRLRALVRWRFEKAKKTNRAIFMILSDKELLELSKSSISDFEGLIRSGVLSSKKMNLYGPEINQILKAIAA